jgi:hypothetical protein
VSNFTCPRRTQDGRDSDDSPFKYDGKNIDTWRKREGHEVCSYCGSVTPQALFDAIENGFEITATDKSYKIYVDLPGDGKKRSKSSANFPVEGYKKVPFKKEWRAPAKPSTVFHGKFYFQHLGDGDRKRFIALMNSGKLKFAGNIGFYVLPYFVKAAGSK